MVSVKEPPYSLEVERAVLAILLDGRHADAYGVIKESCPSYEYFYVRNHKLVYYICNKLAESGKRIDLVTVTAEARQAPFDKAWSELLGKLVPRDTPQQTSSVLEEMGGSDFLAELSVAYAPITGLAGNCDTLWEFWRRRQMISQAGKLESAAHSGNAGEAADVAVNALVGLAKRGGQSGTSVAAVSDALRVHDAIQEGTFSMVTGTFGLPLLDKMLPLETSQVVVISAAPGCGKTSLALMAAYSTAKKLGPNSVGFVSLEMTARQLGTITLARESGVDRKAIQRGLLTPSARSRLGDISKEMESAAFYIRERQQNNSIQNIIAWIRQKHIASNGLLRLVVVDYLQIVEASNKKHGERERLVEASQALKSLSLELNLCIMLLSQMNSEGRKADRDSNGQVKSMPEPRLEDLHGSTSIGNDADAVLFIWPIRASDAKGPIAVNFKIAKNRNGGKAIIPAEFHVAHGQRFVEIATCDSQNREVSTNRNRMNSEPDDAEDLFK